jgi:hypothetical protein
MVHDGYNLANTKLLYRRLMNCESVLDGNTNFRRNVPMRITRTEILLPNKQNRNEHFNKLHDEAMLAVDGLCNVILH